MIKKYIQGKKSDKEIFGNIGAWLTSIKIHKELGNAITSEDGDIWYIAENEDGISIGFALARKAKTVNKVHLRYVYGDSIKKDLIKTLIKDVKKEDVKTIWINERESTKAFKELKFSYTPRERSSFGKWELDLQKDKK